MKQLLELTRSFETSAPVFKLIVDNDYSRVSVYPDLPISKFTTKESDDPIQALVNGAYREHFEVGTGSFRVIREDIAANAGIKIRQSLSLFVVNNSKMQKPQQSKLFKWISKEWPRTEYFDGVAIAIYRYLVSFCGPNMRMVEDNQKHVDNAMALLEATMEKYSRE